MKILGTHDASTIEQFEKTLEDDRAVDGVLCADGHLGYSFPIGGTVVYRNAVSPSGVGFDIGCGNKAVKLDANSTWVRNQIGSIMDEIFHTLSFGVGRKNNEQVDHGLFDNPLWDVLPVLKENEEMARGQLGTIGSGNHFVDVFTSNWDEVWVGVHFGSRGLGHKVATHYIKAAGGKDGIHADAVVLDVDSDLGAEYIAAMDIAGQYAYAGRDWVCQKVASILGANIVEEVHNHHNFAWPETHFGEQVWVVRKGSTPIFPGQRSFIGGSMGDISVIVEGVDSLLSQSLFYTTVHGAGRVMSRTQAAGKSRWKNGKKVRISEGAISQEMMDEWLSKNGVTLRGGGLDESPQAYRRLPEVLAEHAGTFGIVRVLNPIGVAMAGENEYDPFKD